MLNREFSAQEIYAPQMNIISPQNSYFVGRHDGSKVRKIAARIRDIAANSDPEMREQVLNEATVKYNNQVLTLRQFLDSFAIEMNHEPDA